MRPTQDLGGLIAAYMARPGAVAGSSPKSRFVVSGLRAAQSASPQTRARILDDVADVLDCDRDELQFLFDGLDEFPESVAVPDYRLSLAKG